MRVFSILTVVTIYVSVCRGQRQGTDTRLGLLASDLGVPPVPGVGVQGRPGQQSNGGQNFPPNSGGGFFTPPDNFNPPNVNSITGGNLDSRSCRCHPPNQQCPQGFSRSTRQLTGVRIANRPGPQCPGQQVCCSGGCNTQNCGLVNGNTGQGPPGPIIQPPTQPNCGKQDSRFTSSQSSNQLEAGFGEFPWMTLITGLNNEYIGGGALISNNVVLTAAHKIHQLSPQSLKVRVGDHNVATSIDHSQYRHVEVSVQRIVIHPQFKISNLHNDVALLFLSQRVDLNRFPHIGSVCLPEQGQLFSPQRCWVTGWGENAFNGGQFQSVLKKVDVPVWDPFVCEQTLRNQPRLGANFNLDKTSFLCAGGDPGKDACTGDGGAPLVCEGSNGVFAVVGLVAWGLGCAQDNIPGVYVNVANYVNFIKQTTGL